MTEGSKNHFSLPDYFQQMSVVVATSTILLQDQTTLHLTDNKYIEGNTKKKLQHERNVTVYLLRHVVDRVV